MSRHFNTGRGFPQTKAEVEALSDSGLHEFMGECAEEPADFNRCLSCYAYLIMQYRDHPEYTWLQDLVEKARRYP